MNAIAHRERKLTEQEVHAIRTSAEGVRALARRLHVSHTLVWQVREFRTYKHVREAHA